MKLLLVIALMELAPAVAFGGPSASSPQSAASPACAPAVVVTTRGAEKAGEMDPAFVAKLSTSIMGIYFGPVAGFSPAKIALELHKAARDAASIANEGFMQNLFFLVRKRNVTEARGDVCALVASHRLPPFAQESGLKSLFAVGTDADRRFVDDEVSRALLASLAAPHPESATWLGVAAKLGGVMTLATVQTAVPVAMSRQRDAERTTPNDHLRIVQLDRIRSKLEETEHVLSMRERVMAMPQPERDAALLKQYLRDVNIEAGALAYRLLLRVASRSTASALRAFLASGLDTIFPSAGISASDLDQRREASRVRTIFLLQEMKVSLLPEEQKLLERNRWARPEAYRLDWEAALDSN